MIGWSTKHHACVLHVRAFPGARRNEVRGSANGQLRVAVTQAAENGKANRALRIVLAESLGVRRSQVEFLSGASSSDKRFLIVSVDQEQLAVLVSTALARGGCANS